MKVKKLENKLNKLSKYYDISVANTTQFGMKPEGTLTVCIREKSHPDGKWIQIFSLNPPHETIAHQKVNFWTLGAKTDIDFWTPEGLRFYIEALKLAEKFLSNKEK